MKKLFLLCFFMTLLVSGFSQVDTSFIYNNNMPYGSLDIRLVRSSSSYFYLNENKTFSFRESAPGVKTESFLDMTSWDSSPYIQGALREKTSTGDLFALNYRLLIPQNYNAAYADGYPLIIVMHGQGESANCSEDRCYHADRIYSPNTNTPPAPTAGDFKLLNNDHQLIHGGKVHLSARNLAGAKLPNDASLPDRSFPGFVLFPQNLNGWDLPSVQNAIRLIRLITKKYNIDDNRIYITGLSNGGQGVYEAVKRAPWLFSAAVTMSAISDAFISNQNMTSKIAHIPIWTFQGGLDLNPTPKKTERYVKQFRDAGAVVRYTLYPELGHGTWNTAWAEPDYFTWLLKRNKANIHVAGGNPVICSASGAKLELAEGFLAYQWELNGQIISGATSASYTATTSGTYRARFSRVANPASNQWNRWSDPITLTVQTPPTADVKQIGTLLLKDLNGATNARLEAVGNFAHYYWYKNGTLIDFPGNADDTVKTAVIPPTQGNGVYTLVVSDFGNCNSAPTSGKTIFFNDQAPINITAPGNFTSSSATPSSIKLNWSDASGNESGFEIWRRKKLNEANYSPWEMATITTANVTTFEDTNLPPTTTFQYKIRAVSNAGRSNYTPADANTALIAATISDTQPPTAPENLKVRPTGVGRLALTWQPATDNTGIKNYIVYYGSDSIATAGRDTTYVLNNLPVNQIILIKVKAVDLSGKRGPASKARDGNTYLSGLYYQHSTGSWFDLDSVDWQRAEYTGIVPEVTLSPKTQEDYYNFRFDGFVFINVGGTYQFRTSSDEGSRLKLNNTVIVDNDGLHKLRTVTSANQNLQKGAQRMMVDFFEDIENDTLVVEYKGPDTNNEWKRLSREVLKSAENVITGVEDDNGPEDSFNVSVYPNPTSQDNINVRVQSVINAPVMIQLYDQVGRNVFIHEYQPDELSEGINLKTEMLLTEGLYIINVQQADMIIRKRVLIRR